MTLLITLLGSFWKPLLGGIGILAGLAVTYFKGHSNGKAAGKAESATTVANAQADAANAQQAQQAAEAKADASAAQAVAAQASLDAKDTAKKVSDSVDQMKPEDVANELQKDWSK